MIKYSCKTDRRADEMEKLLIGTTNSSKKEWFRRLLQGHGVEFLTLEELDVTEEPEETGRTPAENAALKAEFYGKYWDTAVCNDSGLYLDCLPLEDPRQPGLRIRRPGDHRLDDEEMIAYYAALSRSFGGRVLCYYLNGAAVYRRGRVYAFQEDRAEARSRGFYLVDQPSRQRHPGWPLDSLSRTLSGEYFSECPPEEDGSELDHQLLAFFRKALGLP